MKTRTKLKRWFKEANRTISKYFTTSHHKKRKNYNAHKAQHANASVSTIPTDVEVIFKKRTHNKLKAGTGRLFRHSGTILLTKSRGKSSKNRSLTPSRRLCKSSRKQQQCKEDIKFFTEVKNDSSQNSSFKQISSKLDRTSTRSGGGLHLQSESTKKDKDYYKKVLSTLQLAALIRAKKRDADDKFDLHRPQEIYTLNNYHKFSFRKSSSKSRKRELPLNIKLGKMSSSIREYTVKESLSRSSLSKTESSSTFCDSTKQKAIREIKKLLQHEKVVLPLIVGPSTKTESSKLILNKMSYNTLKAKISQIRKRLVDRKTSMHPKIKSNWGGQIIIPTYVFQSTKETDTESVVKMNHEIEPNNEDEETELHMHRPTIHPNYSFPITSSTKQGNDRVPDELGENTNFVFNKTPTAKSTKSVIKIQDGLRCGQSTLIRQKKVSSESANCRSYIPERPSTSKTNTRTHQDNTIQVQEVLRCGQNSLIRQNRNEAKDHRSYAADKSPVIGVQISKTQDTTKHEGSKCGQNQLLKQKKNSSETPICRNYVHDRPSAVSVQRTKSITRTQDTSKQIPEGLRCGQNSQNKISNQTADCKRNYVLDRPTTLPKDVKITKSIMKTDDTFKLAQQRCDQSALLKQKTSSNETKDCRNNVPTSIKSISKPQDTRQKVHLNTPPGPNSQHRQNGIDREQPPVITIKEVPRFVTPSSDYSVCKNEMSACQCEDVRSTQVAFPLRLQRPPQKDPSRASQTSSRSKKKSTGCFQCSHKKSSSRSPSSGSTSSFNSSSHSPVSNPSGKETSTSTHRTSSSDPLDKVQANHSSHSDPDKVTLQSSPSPPISKRSKKSSSSVTFRGRSKSNSPKPSPPSSHHRIKRSKKGSSSVSFGEIPHFKVSTSYPPNSCEAQKQMSARKSSSFYCFRRRSKQSISPKSSKSKGPRFCASCRRKSEMFEKRATSQKANKNLQRPPVVQPVLGTCTLQTCGSPVFGIKYAVVKITYFKYYTTYEMMRSTSDKPKNIPNYVEKIFVTKETKFAIT